MGIDQQIEATAKIRELRRQKDFDAALTLIESLVAQGVWSAELLTQRGELIQIADRDGTKFPDLTLDTAAWCFEKASALLRHPVDSLNELAYFKYTHSSGDSGAPAALSLFEKAEQHAMGGLKDALIGQVKCCVELKESRRAAWLLKKLKSLFPDDEDGKISWLQCEEDIEDEDEIEAKNLIGDICADFVTDSGYAAQLKQVLLGEPGEWVRLTPMILEEDQRKMRLRELFGADDGVALTWLNDPNHQEGFCLIQCYVPKSLWTWTAYHNREYHLERY